MKSCELCKSTATTYCESDQASLCWNCDAKVHGANFLVARHVRCLLCHTCQSVTPWRAAGAKLGHTVSLCERCVNGGDRLESEAENDDDDDDEVDDDVDDGDEEGDQDSDDEADSDEGMEDGDNQVVPWSMVGHTPPPVSSSYSSEGFSGDENEVSKSACLSPLKRSRGNALDIRSEQDDRDLPSSKRRYDYRTACSTRQEDAVSVQSVRLFKDQSILPEGLVQVQRDSSSKPMDAANTELSGKLKPGKSI